MDVGVGHTRPFGRVVQGIVVLESGAVHERVGEEILRLEQGWVRLLDDNLGVVDVVGDARVRGGGDDAIVVSVGRSERDRADADRS